MNTIHNCIICIFIALDFGNYKLADIKNALKGLEGEILGTKGKLENTDELENPFASIKSPEDINSKNVHAITRELFEKILKGEDLSQYSQVIIFLNQKFSKITDDKQQIKEFANAFGIADTTLNALLKNRTLQNVLAGQETYTGEKPYKKAVEDLFINLFPGEELLIKKSPKDILKDYGIDIDHYNPETAKKILENHAKKQTLDSLKQNYFGKRLQIRDGWKPINATTKEKVSYVVIDNNTYRREKKQFDDPRYAKQVLDDLQAIFLSEEIFQVNKQLKAAGIENTID